MISPRVSKALNPQRRKFSLAQIKAGFGGKRRQSSLKASKKHKHKPRAKAANPKKKRRAKAKNAQPKARVIYRTRIQTRTKKVYVAAPKKRRAKAKNPRRKSVSRKPNGPLLAVLSPVGNPYRKRSKKNSMAKAKKRSYAKSSGKKRNPTRRRSVAKKGRGPARHRSRNPFGISGNELVKDGIGAFVGFSAGKKFTPMLGSSMNSSPAMNVLSTAIVAAIAALVANKVDFLRPYARGVVIGGAAAVFNAGWNAWAPSQVTGIWPGVGEFVPGGFPLPQGPVRMIASSSPSSAPNGSQVNVGAFGSAW